MKWTTGAKKLIDKIAIALPFVKKTKIISSRIRLLPFGHLFFFELASCISLNSGVGALGHAPSIVGGHNRAQRTTSRVRVSNKREATWHHSSAGICILIR
jgi:hypothetical protein